MKNFLGKGHSPSPDFTPGGEGNPLLSPPPQFSYLWHSIYPHHETKIGTPHFLKQSYAPGHSLRSKLPQWKSSIIIDWCGHMLGLYAGATDNIINSVSSWVNIRCEDQSRLNYIFKFTLHTSANTMQTQSVYLCVRLSAGLFICPPSLHTAICWILFWYHF